MFNKAITAGYKFYKRNWFRNVRSILIMIKIIIIYILFKSGFLKHVLNMRVTTL